MNNIINCYNDRKKCDVIEKNDGKTVMVYEKDLPYLTLLHIGDYVEYQNEIMVNELKAINL